MARARAVPLPVLARVLSRPGHTQCERARFLLDARCRTEPVPSIASLPTLFGRYTAIVGDHQRLGVTLRRVRDMCAALESNGPGALGEFEPVRLLADLHTDLVQHFAAEEDDGYFGTVVAERPCLSSGVADLKTEHAVMLASVAGLRAIAEDKTRWSELAAPTRRLAEQLQAHEHSETVLLQEMFLRDEGTGED
jgi:hypothetical protein